MTPKEWMQRGVGLETEILVLERSRDRLRDRLTSAVGFHQEGHNESPDPHKFDHLAELNDAIDRMKNQAAGVYTEIVSAVAMVDDARYRTILEMKYLNGSNWDVIAKQLGYSRRHVTKLHGRALKEVGRYIPE